MTNGLKKAKFSFAVRLMLIASAAGLALFVFAMQLLYSQVVGAMRSEALENSKATAHVLARDITLTIDKVIGEVAINASRDEQGQPAPDIVVDEIAFDSSKNKWFVKFSAGAYTQSVALSTFTRPLEGVAIGKSGEAALVDNRSYLIYQRNTMPFANKFCDYNQLQRLLESSSGALTIDTVYNHPGKTFAVFEAIDHPILSKKGITWYVVLIRGEEELFSWLFVLMGRVAALAIALIIAMAVVMLIISRIFIEPLSRIKDGMTRLGYGEMDFNVKIGSKDEIGDLAVAFNQMSDSIKTNISELRRLEVEADRTKDKSVHYDRLKGNIIAVLANVQPSQNVQNLMTAIRIELGEIRFKMEHIDIKDMLKDAIFTFEPKINEKGLDFKLNMPKGKMSMHADSARIKEVLNAVLQNSVKYTKSGHIELSVRDVLDKIEFGISDTGIGIEAEHLTHIFDGLIYAKNGGLSLYLAKTIIQAHNCEIKAESEPHKGTKIIFTVPRATPITS